MRIYIYTPVCSARLQRNAERGAAAALMVVVCARGGGKKRGNREKNGKRDVEAPRVSIDLSLPLSLGIGDIVAVFFLALPLHDSCCIPLMNLYLCYIGKTPFIL